MKSVIVLFFHRAVLLKHFFIRRFTRRGKLFFEFLIRNREDFHR